MYPVGENIDFSNIDETTQFIVADGNRRVCALKLLHDPERAPTEIRSSISKMAEGQDIVEEIEVVVIPEEDKRRLWMSRAHDGAQDGRGRKQWGAQEKARFNSGNKPDRNTVALKLFDYAEKRGLMEPADRKGSLSHMNRLISNRLVASELGLDRLKGDEELLRNRPANEFDAVLALILKEAKEKTLGSQAKAAAISKFGQELREIPGLSLKRIEPEPLYPADRNSNELDSGDAKSPGSALSSKSTSRTANKKKDSYLIKKQDRILSGFEELESNKFKHLYESICEIDCREHTLLIVVGAWSLIESLSNAVGKPKGASFKDFFSTGKRGRLAELGLHPRQNAIHKALENIADYGNITKHDPRGASYNSDQLINDMATLTPLIVACTKELRAMNG